MSYEILIGHWDNLSQWHHIMFTFKEGSIETGHTNISTGKGLQHPWMWLFSKRFSFHAFVYADAFGGTDGRHMKGFQRTLAANWPFGTDAQKDRVLVSSHKSTG
jgi:hypothetical protein